MRYRGFISYSQRDKPVARRLHRALETYRLPKGVDATVGPTRRLGRFFRDDDEMGAGESLGAALEGALDDAENLIVLCSPSAAQSKWVDSEVRRFKRRGSARVFAVIASGEPNCGDPNRECFPPCLKVRIDAEGNSTSEPDEPRAPDLKRDGMQRVTVELAAGLLNIPFDSLWQRDRRRARQNRLLTSAAALVVLSVFAVVGLGWLTSRGESRTQGARQALSLSRSAAADGRISEALTRLTPFLDHRDTRQLVEGPLRAMLGWIPDPYADVKRTGLAPARLRDATVLLDPRKGVYDMSDVGVKLERLIRSRDGARIVAIGDQRIAVFEAKTGRRLAQIVNDGVQWFGHAFEAPSGLIVVMGAVVGPTNGSVAAYVLSISSDGITAQRHALRATVFFGSAIGITPSCGALMVALEDEPKQWHIQRRELGAGRLGELTELAPAAAEPGNSNADGVGALAAFGKAFATRDAFDAKLNPFTAAGCTALAMDDGFEAGAQAPRGAQVITLEPGLAFESANRWTPTHSSDPVAPSAYLPACTEARPCPVIGGRKREPYVRGGIALAAGDQAGPPPGPRWSRKGAPADAPIYFEHHTFNSGHQLIVCRPKDGRDVCLDVAALGEDQLDLPFLRSPDGRYLFWPFGGSVFDLETLQPLTASRAVPTTPGSHFDFETDRPALTLAVEGRLISFVANAAGDTWTRSDTERASPPFGVLSVEGGKKALHTFASLGGRQYLAVRGDGVLARIDAVTGREVWRITAVGLGDIQDVQLNSERHDVLLMGKNAWRVFRLADGFAVSGLLAPPPALVEPTRAAKCKLRDAMGPRGELVASCGEGLFAWQPRTFTGDLGPQLARLTCTADLKTSALETIRRCYVNP